MAVNLPKFDLPAEVTTRITSCIEFLPGVAANARNASVLLDHLRHEKRVVVPDGPAPPYGLAPRTEFLFEDRRNKPRRLVVRVWPALEKPSDYVNQFTVSERYYEFTPEGLISGISDGKAALRNLKRGWCEPCLGLERPRKRLKGTGLPLCPECLLSAALSSSAGV